MKLCLIRQFGGLGDIIFSQGISDHYSNLGYRVIWPVMRELVNEVKYLKSSAEFLSIKKQIWRNLSLFWSAN